jgi:hypothetical protein
MGARASLLTSLEPALLMRAVVVAAGEIVAEYREV